MNKEILKYFPDKIKSVIEENVEDLNVEEIRIRNNKPIILKASTQEKTIRYYPNSDEMMTILQLICENSIYTYQKQIAEGFVTLKGGHRVGLSGSCVVENGKVINISYINSFNFRISRQIIGCSKDALKYILDQNKNEVKTTLIESPPGSGKTTILRDIVRQISSGIKTLKFKGQTVGIVDERGEIASLYKGEAQNEIGSKTDVIENVSKSIGMKMLIRAMAPKVIVADEIGGQNDIEIIKYAICSGCKGIFTAHGASFDDIYVNPVLKELISSHIFEVIMFLSPKHRGEILEVYKFNKKTNQYEKQDEEEYSFSNLNLGVSDDIN